MAKGMWETINVLLPYPTTIASDPKCVLILFAYPTCFLRRNDTSTSLPRQSQTAVQFEISIDSLQFTRLARIIINFVKILQRNRSWLLISRLFFSLPGRFSTFKVDLTRGVIAYNLIKRKLFSHVRYSIFR